MMNITEACQKFGLTLRTLRFWEQKGILHPVKKGESRFYDERAISEIERIISLKALGIELNDIWRINNGEASVESMLQGLKDKAGADLVEVHARLAAIAEWEGQ